MKNNKCYNPEELEIRYSNWISMMVSLVKPKNLYFVGGRGTAKTTDILAKRSIDIFESMPRSTIAFISDTYVNAMTNLIPELQGGWERQQFYEDVHYVKQKAPLDWFDKPIVRTDEYQHTIHTLYGNRVLIKSLDRPSINAGISVVHIIGDESKHHPEIKIKKTIPILRGDASLFGQSHYFMGQTYLTDMPNPFDGEHDWIMKQFDNMNIQQIFTILKCSLVCNDIEWELFEAEENGASRKVIENIMSKLNRWYSRLQKLRFNSTFFVVASSLANVDILTFDYILNQIESLEFDEVKVSILSLLPAVSRTEMFYSELAPKHFYNDGYNYNFFDNNGYTDANKNSCKALKYLNPKKPMEGGMDFGNMISFVCCQSNSEVIRFLKEFYALSPQWIPDIAAKFLDYFNDHPTKMLNLYYDRSGNAYQRQGKDFANQVKTAIERDVNGRPTGWFCNLLSLGQGTLYQGLEYDLCNQMMGEKNPLLPKIEIDKNECPALKASLELAKSDVKYGKNGTKYIIKVKTSEKKLLHLLPFKSTNMSDAFKYAICRREYIQILRRK